MCLHAAVEEIKPRILCSITFSGNSAVFETKRKNVVQTEGLQMKIKYGGCALHAGKLRLQIHTRNM
jgi:hypothetical protein